MRPPICICNGVIRSGSTWSFNVCRELYQLAAGRLKTIFKSAYVDSASLEQFVAMPGAGLSALTVLKAHDIGPVALKAIRGGLAKAVCTFRDPRDCVASDLAFAGVPFEICVKRISSTLEPLRLFQSTPNMLLVSYEQMMTGDRILQIHRIAKHLSVDFDDATAKAIDARTNLETSQKVCQGLATRPAGSVIQAANHRVDPATHLHDNHINGGTIGRWKTELTADQIEFTTEYFSPWLISLGYETTQSIATILNRSNVGSESYQQVFAPPTEEIRSAQFSLA